MVLGRAWARGSYDSPFMSLIVVPITLPNSTKNEADEAQGLKYLDRLGGFIYSIAIRNP